MKPIEFRVILVQRGQIRSPSAIIKKSRLLEFLVNFSKTEACNISLYSGEMFWSYHILNFWFPWLTDFCVNVTNVLKWGKNAKILVVEELK